jgi:hypothetical protein
METFQAVKERKEAENHVQEKENSQGQENKDGM